MARTPSSTGSTRARPGTGPGTSPTSSNPNAPALRPLAGSEPDPIPRTSILLRHTSAAVPIVPLSPSARGAGSCGAADSTGPGQPVPVPTQLIRHGASRRMSVVSATDGAALKTWFWLIAPAPVRAPRKAPPARAPSLPVCSSSGHARPEAAVRAVDETCGSTAHSLA